MSLSTRCSGTTGKALTRRSAPTTFLSLILLAWTPTALGQNKPVLIQPQIHFQRMDGFGVSGSNGCASEIYNLPSAERLELFDLLFSAKEAGLNILRNEIGWTGERIAITARLRLTGLTYSFGGDDREKFPILASS